MSQEQPTHDKYLKLLGAVREAKPMVVALDELVRLCDEITISTEGASVVYGEHWCVYSHPVSREDDNSLTDILIHIHPKEADVENSAMGLRLWLSNEKVKTTWLCSGPTNEYGQTWFKSIRAGSHELHLNTRHIISINADFEQVFHARFDETTPEASSSFQGQMIPAAASISGSKTLFFEDRKIRIHLEPIDDQYTRLTVSTKSLEFKNTKLVIHVCGQTEEVELRMPAGEDSEDEEFWVRKKIVLQVPLTDALKKDLVENYQPPIKLTTDS